VNAGAKLALFGLITGGVAAIAAAKLGRHAASKPAPSGGGSASGGGPGGGPPSTGEWSWLPDGKGQALARDAAILAARDRWEFDFATVTIESGSTRIVVPVFADALKIDGVRVTLTARCEQLVADALDCAMLSPLLVDAVHSQADVRVPGLTDVSDYTMGSNRVMLSHDARVNALIPQGTPRFALVSSMGKDWVLDNSLEKHPTKACNYGLIYPNATYASVTGRWRVAQQPGTAHTPDHWDYSQVCRLASRRCLVDGVERDLLDLYRDPTLGRALNVGGPLRVVRQPGV
jgi:hypothetical protein